MDQLKFSFYDEIEVIDKKKKIKRNDKEEWYIQEFASWNFYNLHKTEIPQKELANILLHNPDTEERLKIELLIRLPMGKFTTYLIKNNIEGNTNILKNYITDLKEEKLFQMMRQIFESKLDEKQIVAFLEKYSIDIEYSSYTRFLNYFLDSKRVHIFQNKAFLEFIHTNEMFSMVKDTSCILNIYHILKEMKEYPFLKINLSWISFLRDIAIKYPDMMKDKDFLFFVCKNFTFEYHYQEQDKDVFINDNVMKIVIENIEFLEEKTVDILLYNNIQKTYAYIKKQSLKYIVTIMWKIKNREIERLIFEDAMKSKIETIGEYSLEEQYLIIQYLINRHLRTDTKNEETEWLLQEIDDTILQRVYEIIPKEDEKFLQWFLYTLRFTRGLLFLDKTASTISGTKLFIHEMKNIKEKIDNFNIVSLAKRYVDIEALNELDYDDLLYFLSIAHTIWNDEGKRIMMSIEHTTDILNKINKEDIIAILKQNNYQNYMFYIETFKKYISYEEQLQIYQNLPENTEDWVKKNIFQTIYFGWKTLDFIKNYPHRYIDKSGQTSTYYVCHNDGNKALTEFYNNKEFQESNEWKEIDQVIYQKLKNNILIDLWCWFSVENTATLALQGNALCYVGVDFCNIPEDDETTHAYIKKMANVDPIENTTTIKFIQDDFHDFLKRMPHDNKIIKHFAINGLELISNQEVLGEKLNELTTDWSILLVWGTGNIHLRSLIHFPYKETIISLNKNTWCSDDQIYVYERLPTERIEINKKKPETEWSL